MNIENYYGCHLLRITFQSKFATFELVFEKKKLSIFKLKINFWFLALPHLSALFTFVATFSACWPFKD